MNYKEMTIEDLEKLYSEKMLELRELDAEFTACKVDELNAKTKIEKDEIRDWRIQAVEDKKDIVSALGAIRAETKIKNNANGDYISVAESHRQNMSRLDRIIELLEKMK